MGETGDEGGYGETEIYQFAYPMTIGQTRNAPRVIAYSQGTLPTWLFGSWNAD